MSPVLGSFSRIRRFFTLDIELVRPFHVGSTRLDTIQVGIRIRPIQSLRPMSVMAGRVGECLGSVGGVCCNFCTLQVPDG
jgi:hypothetical protein